jgi:hypothetical protein
MKIVLMAVAALTAFMGAAQAAGPSCDRACLEGFVDQYLAALVASDPAKLPLAKNARYTENGQELKLGDGMWGPTITLGNIFHQALAPTEGRPRAELIRVANSYFEGIEAGTDKNTPFDEDCQRIENGVITSNDPSSKSEITPDELRRAVRHRIHQGDYARRGAALPGRG